MPPYQASGFSSNTPVKQLIPGITAYLLGSLDLSRPIRKMIVTSVAVASNVVTLGVKILEGYIPQIGDLITVVNTASDSGAANVTNVALSAVSIVATTGIGTVSYAATATNQSTTPDSGMAYVPVPEVPETLANGTSQAVSIPEQPNDNENGITITWSTWYPSQASTVTATLETAMVDQDAQYSTLDTSTAVGGEIRSITLTRYRFLRVVISNVSGGTLPTVLVRIDI